MASLELEMLALRRLGGVLLTTSRYAASLGAAAARGRWNRHLAAGHTRGWAVEVCGGLGLRVRVYGKAPEGPVLFVPNHRSYTDIVALASVVPCTFLAKSEVASWPLLGQAAAAGGTLFVQRGSKQSRCASRVAVAKALRAGVSVVVFPEGTSTGGPDVLPFRKGIFDVAASEGVSVVPVAIHYEAPEMAWVGDDTFVAHFQRVFRRPSHQVELHFGPALTGSDSERLRQEAWSWCRNRVQRLCGAEPHQEEYHAHL